LTRATRAGSRWTPAMVAGLRSWLMPGEKFRLFDSGDL
jgi:hypothetical protein